MELKILHMDPQEMRFLLTGVGPRLANAIRRAMISEVPTMAIDDIVILENYSSMYDEILAHRLGLIPLITDLNSYVPREVCGCGSDLGCSRCTATLTLEAEAKEGPITVYSGDLKSESGVRPVSERIPILKLAPGQRIKLEAYARLGKGKEHAKWQPTSTCSYKNLPRIKIDGKRCDACGRCVAICPKGVLGIEGPKLVVKNEMACTLCGDCVRACPISPSPITIAWDRNSFIFTVRSVGSLSLGEIFRESCKAIKEKAMEMSQALSTI
ncbi:MAG: DNA-directed RNA polymerase subunit D [Candidatus Bathyarchaeia archaeon]